MTALDRAFIRAYRRAPDLGEPTASASEPPAGEDLPEAADTDLQKADQPRVGTDDSQCPDAAVSVAVETVDSVPESTLPAEDDAPCAEPLAIADDDNREFAAAQDSNHSVGEGPNPASGGETDPEGGTGSPPPAEGNPANSTADPNVDSLFQPAYQVDSFVWPAECTKLGLKAGSQLARLIDGLTAGRSQGHKVIAMTACRRGAGCTTLLICAARRLARGDRRVVIVDADFENPELAGRLGVLPETSWEAVLAGNLELTEAMVGSAKDRLVLIPLLNKVTKGESSPLCYSEFAASLGLLRKHFDVILVDLGKIPAEVVSESAGHWIDGAVLVHDIRHTSQAELMQARKHVEAAGVVEIGVVENFV